MSDRIRLVVMGGSCVGKSAIVKRFLFGDFPTKHVATIEGKINIFDDFNPNHNTSSFLKFFIVQLTLFNHVFSDLFSRDFELGEQAGGSGKPNVLKVDILDTAGAYEFPPMRR